MSSPKHTFFLSSFNKELLGKEIIRYDLQNCEKLQNMGFVNKSLKEFDRMCGAKIESVVSRGNVIRLKLDNSINLVLAPEYGGKILYHTEEHSTPPKFHIKILFRDKTVLTVSLVSIGAIQALKDEELENSYVYRRDFSATASPINDAEFTFENFSKEAAVKNINIKSALVGKDAVIAGLTNSAFQDVLYRAKIHPKRKSSELNEKREKTLYDAIKLVIQERIRLGGKAQFVDLYGKQGKYVPAMGPNMKEQNCPELASTWRN